MTRSIFDPTGPDTERSGSRNLGPAPGNLSHMPSDVTDGKVSEEEAREQQAATGEPQQTQANTPDSVGFDAAGNPNAQSLNNPDATIVPAPDDLSNPGRDAR